MIITWKSQINLSSWRYKSAIETASDKEINRKYTGISLLSSRSLTPFPDFMSEYTALITLVEIYGANVEETSRVGEYGESTAANEERARVFLVAGRWFSRKVLVLSVSRITCSVYVRFSGVVRGICLFVWVDSLVFSWW